MQRLGRLARHAAALVLGAAAAACSGGTTLPPSLTDEEFWRLSADLSEPAGTFAHSENLVSNELQFVNLARALRPSGGVYIGVGPEQNFSYIAALRPSIAFIIDIRRENRNLHLVYKALFELSADRADFLSRLFSRERPAGLSTSSSAAALFAAFDKAAPSATLLGATLALVRDRLLSVHRFPLATEDVIHIDYVLQAFFDDGPAITYSRSNPADEPRPTYAALMTQRDIDGRTQSYLASEGAFAAVKALHGRNLIVPVIGDFAGPTAIRGVGEYVRQRDGTVSVFYGSNVEVYLSDQKTLAYCANIATLPYTATTWFLDSRSMKRFPAKLKTCPAAPKSATRTTAGQRRTFAGSSLAARRAGSHVAARTLSRSTATTVVSVSGSSGRTPKSWP
jgi:hypothetical protein